MFEIVLKMILCWDIIG